MIEHIIQDAGSTDGTLAFLGTQPNVQTYVEKDAGMYDAINRGIQRSSGEIIAYLNADEQYLPGALKAVAEHFSSHPELDILVSDYIVTDADGQFVCQRFANHPYWAQVWYRFGFSSAGLFVRRSLFFERGLWFDTNYRAISDALWYLAACRQKCRWNVLRRFTSIFTETGNNLALKHESLIEARKKAGMIPRWVRLLSPILIAHYR